MLLRNFLDWYESNTPIFDGGIAPRTLVPHHIHFKDYYQFLEHIGCKHTRTTGGHAHYTRSDLSRPITLQTHIDPVPEFIIKQHLRALGLSKNEFLDDIAMSLGGYVTPSCCRHSSTSCTVATSSLMRTGLVSHAWKPQVVISASESAP